VELRGCLQDSGLRYGFAMTFNLFQLTLFLLVLVALGFGCRTLAARGEYGAIGPLVAGCLSLGCFCLSGSLLWQSYRLVKGAVSAEGEVIRIIVSSNTTQITDPNYRTSSHTTETTTTAKPVVRFQPRGSDRTVEFTALGNKTAGYTVGEHVNLYYSPGEPEEAKLNIFGDLWLPGIFLAVFGFILGLAAWIMWFVWRKLFRSKYKVDSLEDASGGRRFG